MDSFKKYLLDKFGDTAKNLSKSDDGNCLVDDTCFMISLDKLSTELFNSHAEIKEKYASTDALYIVKRNNSFEFYFFEFKGKDFNSEEDKLQYLSKLKEHINEMENCEHDCEISKEIKKCSKELSDKSFLKLKIKPYDSLALIYFSMNDFFKSKSSKECVKELCNIKKFYILVSRTDGQYNPNLIDLTNPNSSKKNKSNRNNITKSLLFMKRLIPYHFDNVANLNSKNFKNLIHDLNEIK